MGAFALALRSGEGAALRFLDAPPRDDATWRAALDEAAACVRPLPPSLLEAVLARQTTLGAGALAEANARRLTEPGVLAVVTGQQPGLFGGPLLTFHKVAGAIHLARRLHALGGPAVIPVFWCASEDHDFEEANRAAVLDRKGEARSMRVDIEGDGRSISDIDAPKAAVDAALAELEASLPDTERGRAALALARYDEGDDFATWTAKTLLRVFGDSGLVVIEPRDLTAEVGPSWGWLLDHAETICQAVAVRGAELRAHDLPAPLLPGDADTPLFFRERAGSRRLRVGVASEAVTLRDQPSSLSRAQLRDVLLSEPERGSGNVIGRVFVQNRLLPVLAYIAGPTEIAYHAQLRAAHEAVGMRAPLALPRPEGTWVDGKSAAAADAFDLSIAQVLRGVTPAVPDDDVDAALAEARETWLSRWPAPVEGLAASGGQGAEALERMRTRLLAAWDKNAPRVRDAFHRDRGVGRDRWHRLSTALFPLGARQERVLSPLSFIARYGVEPIREGLLSLDPLAPVHTVVRLENAAS